MITWAVATALLAVIGNISFPAGGGGQVSTVGPLVITRSSGGEGSISGSSHSLAVQGDHGLANTAHPNASGQSDVTLLSPSYTQS